MQRLNRNDSPNNPEWYYKQGVAFHKQKKFDDAIASYQEVLKLIPNHAQTYYMLGAVYQEQGKKEEAIAHYRKTIEINPSYEHAHYNIGYLCFCDEVYDQAIEALKNTVKLNHNHTGAYYYLACSYKSMKQYAVAIENYLKCIELDPYHWQGFLEWACQKIASCYYLMSNLEGAQLDDAMKYFQMAKDINPDCAIHYFHCGLVYEAKENFDQAIAYYHQAITLDPKFSEAFYNLGSLYHKQKASDVQNETEKFQYYQEAAKHYETHVCIELEREEHDEEHNLLPVYFKLATVYKHCGIFGNDHSKYLGKRIECYNKVVELDDSYKESCATKLEIRKVLL